MLLVFMLRLAEEADRKMSSCKRRRRWCDIRSDGGRMRVSEAAAASYQYPSSMTSSFRRRSRCSRLRSLLDSRLTGSSSIGRKKIAASPAGMPSRPEAGCLYRRPQSSRSSAHVWTLSHRSSPPLQKCVCYCVAIAFSGPSWNISCTLGR